MTEIKKLSPEKEKGLLSGASEYTYTKGNYYINNSGVVCPLPDQIEARAEIRSEYLDIGTDYNGK